MKNIIIIGGGGHAKVIASLLKKHNDWNPIGYTDLKDNGELLGLPYLGTDDIISQLMEKENLQYAVIGIGQIKNIQIREKIIAKIENTNIILPPIISPDALINEGVKIDNGTVIMDGAIIQPDVKIGKYSIVNTGTTIDHDCEIGDFVHIAPGVNLSGEVKIQNNVLIGTGAKVIQDIRIVENVIVAGGSAVMGDLVESGKYIGVPARKLSKEMFKKRK